MMKCWPVSASIPSSTMVDRDGLDERLEIVGVGREAVDAAVQRAVEELPELGVEVLARGREPLLQVGRVQHPDLGVEAVEERDVARLVGDLRAQEDPHVLVGDRAHDRPELGGHALLADEERAHPVHPLEALVVVEALVPVDAVLAEVEILRRPVLALPQLVELAVGEQVRLAAVRRLVERRIARRPEVDAACAMRGGRLGHGATIPPRRLAASPPRARKWRQPPIENIASRSWREKTSKATIVCVRLTPGSFTSSPVTTSASISCRGTRMIATKSHSPVTEYASATPSRSASWPPSVCRASRSASMSTTAVVIACGCRRGPGSRPRPRRRSARRT